MEAVVQGNLAAILPVEARPLGYNRGAGGRTWRLLTKVFEVKVRGRTPTRPTLV